MANEIEETIPTDTYAGGLRTAALYSMINCDTGYYINDWPDLGARSEALEAFLQDLYKRETVFADSELMVQYDVVEKGNFNVQHEFVFDGRKYYYLVSAD